MKINDINLIPTKKPKFSSHRGRTWDTIPVVIAEEEIKGFIDTTWGLYVYFFWNGRWYKVNLLEVNKNWDSIWKIII